MIVSVFRNALTPVFQKATLLGVDIPFNSMGLLAHSIDLMSKEALSLQFSAESLLKNAQQIWALYVAHYHILP